MHSGETLLAASPMISRHRSVARHNRMLVVNAPSETPSRMRTTSSAAACMSHRYAGSLSFIDDLHVFPDRFPSMRIFQDRPRRKIDAPPAVGLEIFLERGEARKRGRFTFFKLHHEVEIAGRRFRAARDGTKQAQSLYVVTSADRRGRRANETHPIARHLAEKVLQFIEERMRDVGLVRDPVA